MLNYGSFAASALFYGLLMAKKADVMYAYHPPLSVGITACIVRFFRRIPVVYDIQDVWPDTLRATGMLKNPYALDLVGSVCNWVYRRADHIVVLSMGFKWLLIQRGVPESKQSVIYNWADEPSLSCPVGHVTATFPESDRFIILFAGNMGKAQALDTVLEAAEMLQQQSSRVCWVMLGGGVELDRLKAEASRRKLNNVVFLPAVSMAQVGIYLQAADALLVHLRKDPLFEITIPSKTQAYMSVGRPLLMAVDGEARSIVEQSGGGVVAESENPQALAQAAQSLANSSTAVLAAMGQQAKVFYQQHMALAVGAKRFGELFEKLAQKSRSL
jgi:glycosyltransferase involved in cell wall biosynthesis